MTWLSRMAVRPGLRRSVVRIGLGTLLGVCCPVVACGARTGLLLPSSDGGSSGEETSCVGTDVPVDPNVPNLYFVLDASSSMSEMNKWTNVRSVVGNLLTQLGPSAQFGAAVFPSQGTADACHVNVDAGEVMPLRPGDSQGVTENVFLQATSFQPNGGTPTAPTLEALTPKLRLFRSPTFVILATDGGPNCNAALSCDVSTCTSNIDGVAGCPVAGPNCCNPKQVGGLGCLDGDRAAQAVAQLQASGIQTYVLGIPGSAPYASVLDTLATVGGTAQSSEPLYYRVDTADTGTLSAALSAIAARTMASCVFTLSQQPDHANAVNVAVGGSLVPQHGPDGWSLAGVQLTLRGASCGAIQGQGSSPVSVTQGCPTVL